MLVRGSELVAQTFGPWSLRPVLQMSQQNTLLPRVLAGAIGAAAAYCLGSTFKRHGERPSQLAGLVRAVLTDPFVFPASGLKKPAPRLAAAAVDTKTAAKPAEDKKKKPKGDPAPASGTLYLGAPLLPT